MAFTLTSRRWTSITSLGVLLGAAECGPVPSAAQEPALLVMSDDAAPPNSTNLFVISFGSTARCYLTAGSNLNISPAWSNDGTKIVYASNEGNTSFIWTMDASGDNKTRLTFSGANSGVIVPAFSPDGTHIVYAGFQTGHPEIWVTNSDGTNQQQLTATSRSGSTRNVGNVIWSVYPTYSPDGKKIVYASTQSGNSEIWVMNADGTNQTQLTFPSNLTSPDANAPAWSPDGTKIAFWSGYAKEYGNVWVMYADGTGRKQLTFESEVNINSDNPNWSPDGNYIMFESNRRPNGNLGKAQTWIMGSDGSNPTVLFPFSYGAGRRPWRTATGTPRFICRN